MARSRSLITRKQRNATDSTTEPRPPIARPDDERLAHRLAEMVTALSECEPRLAVEIVRSILTTHADLDALEVVAMALIAVEARQRGQLRVPGYLRPDGQATGVSARRALRRARREPASPPPEPAMVPAAEPEPVVLDLRGEHAQLHLDLTGPGSDVS